MTNTVNLRVFISWSGKDSKSIASRLRAFLKCVFEDATGTGGTTSPIDFWISFDCMGPGDRWRDVLNRELETTNFAIVCFVPSNVRAPWIHYEAGAISKKLNESCIIPYCVGLSNGLDGPLSDFQAAPADKLGTFRVVKKINELLHDKISLITLTTAFNTYWDEFQRGIESVLGNIEGISRKELKRLSVSALLRQEAPGVGLIDQSHVYVNSSQPIESTDGGYAQRVMQNMALKATYCYVFKLDMDNATHIADMLVKLAKASQGTTVDTNISTLGTYLRIHLVEESYGLEYCVLNAKLKDAAHCYLRQPRELCWLDWCEANDAYEIANEVRDLCRELDNEAGRIIRSTKGCRFYTDSPAHKDFCDFRDALKRRIRSTAGVTADKLIPLCIGSEGIVARNGIRTVADLRGKKIAFQSGSPSEFFLRDLLLGDGMSLNDLQTLDMETAQACAAFVAGQIDAGVVWEPWLTKAVQQGGGHVLASVVT